MNKSIKDVLNEFESYVKRSLMMESFETNLNTEIKAANRKYPLLFIEVGAASVTPGQVAVSMDCYFLDRLANANTNLTDVISEQLLNATDFYSIYNDNETQYGFYLSDDMNAEPIQVEYEDRLAGYKLPITVQIYNSRNEKDVPLF